MRRPITQIGQSILEWLFTRPAQDNMVALAKLSSAILGTSTQFSGLAVGPTSPASLQVSVAPGEIYMLTALEGTAYGTLPADTTHQIVKQGINLDAVLLTIAAPSVAGQSINYLIQATFQETDISVDPTSGASPVVLPFYNDSNPTQPYSGPNNTGQTSNTFRQGSVVLNAKAGISATTGSQVTPTPDSGYVGIAVVTVANGQTTITSGNISAYSGAPAINSTLHGNSPAFSVSPTAPTPATSDNSTKLSTTAYVRSLLNSFGVGATSNLSVSDMDDATLGGGLYYCSSATAGTWPSSVSPGNAFLLNRVMGTAGFQMLVLTSSDQVWYRRRLGSAWQPWVSLANSAPRQSAFTSSGSFTVPPGVTTLYISAVAGGGGGGAGAGGTSATGSGGGGGGAGASVLKLAKTVSPGETLTITVGGAGSGSSGAGSSGGTTSVSGSVSGLLQTLTGGTGGAAGTNATGGSAGGSGGAGFPSGSDGQDTSTVASGSPSGTGGVGASSPFGGGGGCGRGASVNGVGGKGAAGYGSGGGGGGGYYTTGGGTGGLGGNGTPGWVLIEW